jgi:hypothetical protein
LDDVVHKKFRFDWLKIGERSREHGSVYPLAVHLLILLILHLDWLSQFECFIDLLKPSQDRYPLISGSGINSEQHKLAVEKTLSQSIFAAHSAKIVINAV